MSIRPDCISRPMTLTSRTFVPDGGIAYPVKDGDSWESLARRAQINAWQLIRFNYPTLPVDSSSASREVNWYLQEYVGCRALTADSKNYRFTSGCKSGLIYLPSPQSKAELQTPSSTQPIPVVTDIKARRESILKNIPAIFQVAPDETVKAYSKPWYSLESEEETTMNWLNILKSARYNNLDPDFVAAIVWMESTHGWYDAFDPHNKTIRPMNIHAKLWEQLGVSRNDLDNPEINIAEGSYILKAIWDRTEDPDFEKVATLYNQLGATKVNGYGKTIVQYMRQKPWARILTDLRQRNSPKRNGLKPLPEWKNQ